MLTGSIDGNDFILDKGIARAHAVGLKELLESLRGRVYNPITKEGYETTVDKSDLDAYLLLCNLQQESPFKIVVDAVDAIEGWPAEPDREGVVY